MALDASILTQQLDKFQKDLFDDINKNQTPYKGQAWFLSEMSKIIDDHFQLAEPAMKNVVITAPKGSLSLPALTGVDGMTYCTAIASEISRYWAEAITMDGIPVGGVGLWTIISVANDASKIISPLATEIYNLRGMKVSVGYSKFAEAIIKNVLTITWTVVEQSTVYPNPTMTYTVNIS